MIKIGDKKLFIIKITVFGLLAVIPIIIFVYLATYKNRMPIQQKPQSYAQTSGPVRGVSGDLWADVVIGQPDFTETSEWKVVPDKVWNPNGVIIDRSSTPNKLYVWDAGNSRILGFDLGKCLQKDLNTRCAADLVIGQPDGFSGACNGDSGYQGFPNRAPASASTLCGLEETERSPGEGGSSVSMAVDKEGNLYVPDVHNNRVLKYIRPFETDAVADEVWGQDDFTGNGRNKKRGQPDATTFDFEPFANRVVGVDIDEEGYLWVADAQNNRVLRFLPGAKTADLVLGQPSFNLRSEGTELNNLKSPGVVRVEGRGEEKKVYVADVYNDRVLVYKAPFSNGMSGELFGSGFKKPTGIEFDPAGEGIWINDTRVSGKSLLELWNFEGTAVIKVIGAENYAAYSSVSLAYQNLDNPYFRENFGSFGIDVRGNVCLATRWGHLPGTGQNVLCYLAPFPTPGTAKDAEVKFFYPPEGDNLVTQGELGAGKGVVASNNQLIVADLGRVLYWDSLSALRSGQPADGIIAYDKLGSFPVSDQPADFTVRPQNYWDRALAVDRQNHLYILHGRFNNPEILVYELPLSPGKTVLKKISFPIPFLGLSEAFAPKGNFEVGGIAVSPDGKFLWMTESDASRVVRIRDPLSSPVADLVLGQESVSEKGCNRGGFTCEGHWCAPTDASKTASSLCLPGMISLDRLDNLYVADNSIETRGNRRLMVFSAGLLPTKNTSVVFGVSATKIFDKIEGSQPAFDSQNRMVWGFNPFRSRIDAGLSNCLETPGVNSCNFLGYFLDPLKAGSFLPDGYLQDFFVHPYSLSFDENDNLYVGDMNRARILIYQTPLVNFPTPTPSCLTTFSQTVGNGAYNLGTTYSSGASVNFAPPFSAGINLIDVMAGMWGSYTDSITCKLEGPGSTFLGETTTASFSGGGAWRALIFPSVMNLTAGTTYTLYCRKTNLPNFSAYWNYNTANNLKTYRFHLGNCSPAPTNTQTPTPSIPSCQNTFSQTVANGAYNLGTGYSSGASIPFTPPLSAGVKVIDVMAGMWGSYTDSITCKLEGPGSTFLGETTTASFSGGGAWRALIFPSVMNLTAGTTYTLYCRKTNLPNFSAYWNYNTANNLKTYRFHLGYCQPTPK